MFGHDHAFIGNEGPSAMHSGTLMPFGFFLHCPVDVFAVKLSFNPLLVVFRENFAFAMRRLPPLHPLAFLVAAMRNGKLCIGLRVDRNSDKSEKKGAEPEKAAHHALNYPRSSDLDRKHLIRQLLLITAKPYRMPQMGDRKAFSTL